MTALLEDNGTSVALGQIWKVKLRLAELITLRRPTAFMG